MKICRFENHLGETRVGMEADESALLDLTEAGAESLASIIESADPAAAVAELAASAPPRIGLDEVRILAPVERQEVWAAGVTYQRSKAARMEESDFSASAYDRVYDAVRPEIFFKSMPEKVVGPGEPVGIRGDATWSVPEPELALVLNSRGEIAGYTIGNDMSSRDIEGENLLYLPQAKTYARSCALGPWINLGVPDEVVRGWQITLEILRGSTTAFAGETSVSQIKRGFPELAEFLFRSQDFPHGAVLLTGTGVVPADTFTLEAGDEVVIRIDGIGRLATPVVVV